MSLQPGQVLSHYRIERKLGKGGMGEVYRAVDTNLKRAVALKVLPAETASDPERLTRFQREAELVAALNHPHIVTIFSVEEAAGVRFLTMELVDGEGLDQALRAGPLPIRRVFDVGIALADALAAAHQRGIIHRDLKPANVMVTSDGRIKVLDFGLAKLSAGAPPPGGATTDAPTDAEPLTVAGVVMGSGPYMSPEQVNGRALDPRTDIFSLGSVLYELATGRRPFTGQTVMESMLAVLRDEPPPLTEVREEAPDLLAAVIARCHEKDPAERFASAADLRDDLRAARDAVFPPSSAGSAAVGSRPASAVRPTVAAPRWKLPVGLAAVAVLAAASFFVWRGLETPAEPVEPGGPALPAAAPATAPDVASIAVLPFVNLSGDEHEYLCDGLSEELLNVLAGVQGLRVAGRTSSFQFKGKTDDLRDIGRKLNVAHLLEGSVRKAGGRVRITAQLIKAENGFHLWSETYDRLRDDIFDIQDDIARAVADALKVQLLGEDEERAPRRSDSLQSYDLLLQARHLLSRVSVENTAEAKRLLEEALELDPDYAVAWAELGLAHAREAALTREPDGHLKAYRLARQALSRAIELDPELATAHSRMARVASDLDWDFLAAERHAQRALELAPENPVVISNAAGIAGLLGQLERSVELHRKFLEIDPLSAGGQFNLAIDLLRAGRLEEAEEVAAGLLARNPVPFAEGLLARVRLHQGRPEEALAGFERAGNLPGIALAHHALGNEEEGEAALRALMDRAGEAAAVSYAEIHAYRGEPDLAFEWLERAYGSRRRALAQVKVNPLYRNLHGDPRWDAFLDRMGLAD